MRTLKNQRRCKPAAQSQERQAAPAAGRPAVAFVPARAPTLTWSLGSSGRDRSQGHALH